MTKKIGPQMCGVKVYYAGQIGNQLFHYCLGKVLALKYGLAFDPPPHFVDKHGKPVKWTSEPIFTMKATEGRKYDEARTHHFGCYYWYDLDSLPRGRPLHAAYGHWCRYELWKPYRELIRNDWLKIPENRYVLTDDEAVYIHVRRTDFIGNDGHSGTAPTTLEEFVACLERFPDAKRAMIVSDDYNDRFIADLMNALWGKGITVGKANGNWDEDFLVLASCKNLIISQSTFSWWAGFLGRCEKIVCPTFPETNWGRGYGAVGPEREQYPNLFVDDGRWEFVREWDVRSKWRRSVACR